MKWLRETGIRQGAKGIALTCTCAPGGVTSSKNITVDSGGANPQCSFIGVIVLNAVLDAKWLCSHSGMKISLAFAKWKRLKHMCRVLCLSIKGSTPGSIFTCFHNNNNKNIYE